MQALFTRLFLLPVILLSAGAFAQSKETETPAGNKSVPPPPPGNNLNMGIPPASNSHENGFFRMEEKSLPVSPQTAPQKAEIAKKALIPEAPAVTQARMQQQFRINQANASRQYSRRSATPQEQTAMDESVLYLKAAAPESFEAAYFSWLAGHYDPSRISDLRKAEKLQPQNPEIIRQKAMYYSVVNQRDSLDQTLDKLRASGYFTPGQLAYANDLVLSCEPGAVLIVHGFDDYLAVAEVNRSSRRVNLISLDLLQSEEYRELAAKYVAVPAQKEVNVEFLRKLCASSKRPVYLSMTIPANYLQPLKENLYVRGLAFIYSASAIDTYEANRDLWFGQMNRQLLSALRDDAFRIWIPNYKVSLAVLKNQLYANKSMFSEEEFRMKLEAVDNELENIIQPGR